MGMSDGVGPSAIANARGVLSLKKSACVMSPAIFLRRPSISSLRLVRVSLSGVGLLSVVEGEAASGEAGFAGSRSALSGDDALAVGEGGAGFSSAASCLDRVVFSSVRVFCSSLRRAIF